MANPIQGYFDSTSFTLDVNGFPIWNRAVGSEFMAKFAHTVLGNGAAAVTTGGFQVVKKTGMTVTVKPYFICKDGYMMYQKAETDIEFTSSTSEQVFYIGARLDVANNHFVGDDVGEFTTFVSATDLAACKLTITANAVAITDGMIEDLRYNTAYCGQIDEFRERSLALIAELETALDAVIAGGVPAHASTHATAGTDPITPASIGAMASDTMIGNLIINGGFNINQRVKSGTVTLSAGVYGHDRWKAGASGCTYTFATSENVTTLTISAGSLIQVVEGLNLRSGTVCLSWTGTAQGKIGAGSYSASDVTGTVTGGTNLNIEFNAGTLANVQLNYGSVTLPFVPKGFDADLHQCERYYQNSYSVGVAPAANSPLGAVFVFGFVPTAAQGFQFKNRMRVAPTVKIYSPSGTADRVWNDTDTDGAGAVTAKNISSGGVRYIENASSAFVANKAYSFHYTADAEL